jgi:Ni/Fe-hydrogenase 1 B-type cytochrome subunit
MQHKYIHYIWEWPVRITHWLIVLSIIVLSVTGFYIGHPYITTTGTTEFVMGWNRFIHLVFAYIFTLAIISRLTWALLGNRLCDWHVFFPWLRREGRHNILKMFKYYTFLSKELPSEYLGHNSLAACAYSGVMILYLIQGATGFALYSQYSPGGPVHYVFSPLLVWFGPQTLRLTHHLVMWLLISFAIHHVYSAWLMDVKERNGTLGSMFGGYKFQDKEEL